ncbi:MAG TPA: deoxyguanosinetriphosphate triphosphohydrolase [Sulfuriferula sp.]|nr:deoxyguanosinetriphosphate triphosphohydrolase [Sulfuriferula sp.]
MKKRMDWHKLLSSDRLVSEVDTSGISVGRTPFEKDVDKVIFSGAFRRLNRKTQVHPIAANDHIHTRLTHSLEVAQVGRALGQSIGTRIASELPKGLTAYDIGSILQAACLAHDIGNPPFGHAGEEAMGHWFEANGPRIFRHLSKEHKHDLETFEGNAQGFRILTQTENNLFRGGLNLTYATLATFLKYPRTSRDPSRKFGAYITEEKILGQIAEHVGLININKHRWCRHPLAYLVEAADDICYGILDLEDAVELKILMFDDVEKILLKPFSKQEKEKIQNSYPTKKSYRINLGRIRGPVFNFLISGAIDAFTNNYDRIMSGEAEQYIFDLLDADDPRRRLIAESKALTKNETFQDSKKLETELGSYATFECLLETFCQAALDVAQHLKSPKDEAPLIWRSVRVLQLLGDHAPSEGNEPPGLPWSSYQCLRRVIDFTSGMTDNYATYIAKQLQGMAFTGVQRP